MRGILFAVMVILALTAPCLSSGSEADNPVSRMETATDNQSDREQADQKAVGEKTLEVPESKPLTTSNPADKKKTEETPEKTGLGEAKGGNSEKSPKTGASPKKIRKSAQEDRPWIIKKHPRKKSDTPKEKPAPLEWKSDVQRLTCEEGLQKFQKTLEKTRTYSIRGDHCATARHAKNFLDLEGRLRNECPAGFLESNGYSEKIIQNVRVLLELGKKACLEKE